MIIDNSKKTIENIYLENKGKRIDHYDSKLKTDGSVIYIAINDLKILPDYINTSNRFYILLDKSLGLKEYSNSANNIWVIPTNLALPNIIITQEEIYHYNFNLKQSNKSIIKQSINYFNYLVRKYTEQNLKVEIQHDNIEPSNSFVQKNTTNSDYIISNKIYGQNTITNKLVESKNKYYYLESKYINPYDVIRSNKLSCGFVNDQQITVLKFDFEFKLKDYAYKEFYSSLTYDQIAKDNYYSLNGSKVVINQNPVKLKIDLNIKEEDQNKDKTKKIVIDNHVNKYITEHPGNYLKFDIEENIKIIPKPQPKKVDEEDNKNKKNKKK